MRKTRDGDGAKEKAGCFGTPPFFHSRLCRNAMAYLELVGLLVIFALIAWLAWKSM